MAEPAQGLDVPLRIERWSPADTTMIEYEMRDRIATIRLNRPDKFNALRFVGARERWVRNAK